MRPRWPSNTDAHGKRLYRTVWIPGHIRVSTKEEVWLDQLAVGRRQELPSIFPRYVCFIFEVNSRTVKVPSWRVLNYRIREQSELDALGMCQVVRHP